MCVCVLFVRSFFPSLFLHSFIHPFIQGRLVSNKMLSCPSALLQYNVKYDKIRHNMTKYI